MGFKTFKFKHIYNAYTVQNINICVLTIFAYANIHTYKYRDIYICIPKYEDQTAYANTLHRQKYKRKHSINLNEQKISKHIHNEICKYVYEQTYTYRCMYTFSNIL